MGYSVLHFGPVLHPFGRLASLHQIKGGEVRNFGTWLGFDPVLGWWYWKFMKIILRGIFLGRPGSKNGVFNPLLWMALGMR